MTTVLGIESTCDETSIGIIKDGKVVADVTASSMDEYARYGGIIPEIAARAHLESFKPVLDEALHEAQLTLDDVDKIGVSAYPGLAGSLAVGVSAAKTLAFTKGIELVGINHIMAHGLVPALEQGFNPLTVSKQEPIIMLVVSGGHSSLFLVENGAIRELGSTLDDAAGEAFDKVGRLLGLPYPGGPEIDKLAHSGNKTAYEFPRALMHRDQLRKHKYDFSFSGVKTAVANELNKLQSKDSETVSELSLSVKQDISASFAESVCDALVTKTMTAAKEFGAKLVMVGGGFSANSQLRQMATDRGNKNQVNFIFPTPKLSTDNGIMVAYATLLMID